MRTHNKTFNMTIYGPFCNLKISLLDIILGFLTFDNIAIVTLVKHVKIVDHISAMIQAYATENVTL